MTANSGTSAIDLFAGTGTVTALLATYFQKVTAIDRQYYATVLARARVIPATTQLDELFDVLERSHPARTDHPFADQYGEGGSAGRLYFTEANACRIAGMRDELNRCLHSGLYPASVCEVGIAWILNAADQVANCASVYAAYLKKIKQTASRPFSLSAGRHAVERMRTDAVAAELFCGTGDALEFLLNTADHYDFAYLDPPYNHRAYQANYHLIETIARWDLSQFTPRGISGLRPLESPSGWNSRPHAAATLQATLQALQSPSLLFSYSDEGLMSELVLTEQLEGWGKIHSWQKIPYRRYRADSNRAYSRNAVTEWLILVKKN